MTWEVRFARKDCTPCLHRAQCTRAMKEPRLLGLQEREQYETLQAARQRQTTEAFYRQYALGQASRAPMRKVCAGVASGTRAILIGLAKTHLQHLATAAALNFVRLGEWLAGTSRAKTPCSP
jgi:transposase